MNNRFCNEICPVPCKVANLKQGIDAFNNNESAGKVTVFRGDKKIVVQALQNENFLKENSSEKQTEKWEVGCRLDKRLEEEGNAKYVGTSGGDETCPHLNSNVWVSFTSTRR